MLMRAHFLPQLLQSEAYTGGLIFLLPDKAQRGCRVSARPVVASACVHKRVRSHASVRRSVLRCVWLFFFIRVWSECLQMLLPFAPLPIKGHSRMPVPQSPGLQAAYLYVRITQIHTALYPLEQQSHTKVRFSLFIVSERKEIFSVRWVVLRK